MTDVIAPAVTSMRFRYSQDSDSCDSNSLGQNLEIATEDAGGGPFLIISTERWALDAESIDWLAEEMRRVLREAEGR